MDWRDLNSFVTIAREKSISRASNILHLSQSAMTIRLKRLEDEIGTKLVERDWKGITLTKEGMMALYYATKALTEMNAIRGGKNATFKTVCANEAGAGNVMRIGINYPLGETLFPHVVQKLIDRGVDLEFDLISEHYQVVLDLVALGELDLGFVPYLDGRSDLVAQPVVRDEPLLLVPLQYAQQTLEELLPRLPREQPCYFLHPGSPVRSVLDATLLATFGCMPTNVRMINYSKVMMQLIANGIGYALLPSSFLYETVSLFRDLHGRGPLPRRLAHPSVPFVIHRLGSDLPSREINIVYRDDTPHRRKIETIADVFAEDAARRARSLA